MRWMMAKRLAVAVTMMAAIHALLARLAWYQITEWFVRAGRALGGQTVSMGGASWMQGGPFVGEGMKTLVLNWAATHGAGVVVLACAFGAGLGAYALAAVPLGTTRAFGYRGPTRCGRCGYAVSGLKMREGERVLRCPECGGEI